MHTPLLTPGSFQIEKLIKVLTPLIVIIPAQRIRNLPEIPTLWAFQQTTTISPKKKIPKDVLGIAPIKVKIFLDFTMERV
jgi:hypothetical protein